MSSRSHPVATLFPIVLAGFLAALSFWLDIASRPQTSDSDAKLRHDPDYWVENFQLRRFDTEGALRHSVFGELLRHYPDDDSSEVLAPRLIFQRAPSTTITSREALLDSGAKHVQFLKDVQVTRRGVVGKPDTVLSTQHLHAYPDDEIATTEVPATIAQGLSNITGNTMKANNKTAIYELEGAVHGVFFKNRGKSPAPVAAPPVQAAVPTQAVAQAKPETKPKPKAKPIAKPKAKPKSATPAKPKPKPVR